MGFGAGGCPMTKNPSNLQEPSAAQPERRYHLVSPLHTTPITQLAMEMNDTLRGRMRRTQPEVGRWGGRVAEKELEDKATEGRKPETGNIHIRMPKYIIA